MPRVKDLEMRRWISGSLKVLGLLILQVYLWGAFLAQTERHPAGPILIINDALGLSIYIVVLVAWSRKQKSLLRLLILLVYTALLLVINFSFFYWSHGSKVDFSIALTHLDAIYFALGTLSTAGTGNINAMSETARGIQSLQMTLDFGLVVFAIGAVVTRLFTASQQVRDSRTSSQSPASEQAASDS